MTIRTTAGATFSTAGAKLSKLLSKRCVWTSLTGGLSVSPDGPDSVVESGWTPRTNVAIRTTTPKVSSDCGL